MSKAKKTTSKEPTVNAEGLTYEEWFNAATTGEKRYTNRSWTQLFKLAWQEGDDPTDWKAALSEKTEKAA